MGQLTSTKVCARILQVLAFAKTRGWRADSQPDARELRTGLAKQPRGGNFAAIPYRDVPGFVADQPAKEPATSRMAIKQMMVLTLPSAPQFMAPSNGLVIGAWRMVTLVHCDWKSGIDEGVPKAQNKPLSLNSETDIRAPSRVRDCPVRVAEHHRSAHNRAPRRRRVSSRLLSQYRRGKHWSQR